MDRVKNRGGDDRPTKYRSPKSRQRDFGLHESCFSPRLAASTSYPYGSAYCTRSLRAVQQLSRNNDLTVQSVSIYPERTDEHVAQSAKIRRWNACKGVQVHNVN